MEEKDFLMPIRWQAEWIQKSCPCQELNLGQYVTSGTNDWAVLAYKVLLKLINK
jgi:hypothetical protein